MSEPSLKATPAARLLKVFPDLLKRQTRPLHVDIALHRFAPAMRAEAARRLSLHHAVQRRIALVAPHDAVNVVLLAMLFDNAMPPAPVIRIPGARLTRIAPQQIYFQALRHIRYQNRAGRTVARILEQRLHELGNHFHAAFARFRNHQFQNVLARQFRILSKRNL